MASFGDVVVSMAYNNPYNLYGVISGDSSPGTSFIYFAGWQGFTAAAYGIGYAMVGAEASYVGFYYPAYLAGGLALTGWLFGSVTAAAMVYDVHTDPQKKAKLEKFASPGADIFKMTGFGGMSL